jgi:GDPmannose 4,6-dehydratase
MKAIITGITGQDGSHLADLLLNKGYEVVGVTRTASTDNTQRIKHILDHPDFCLESGDVTDVSSIRNILIKHMDDMQLEFYNLAAQSHVAESFKQPAITWDITGKGALNVLQSIVDLDMKHIRFYQASSSEMFGASFDTDVDINTRIGKMKKYQDENTKFLPQSPYAIAKCAAHYMVRIFREAYDLHASAGILFNHEGPRRGDAFVTRKITKWIGNFMAWCKQHGVKPSDLVYDKDEMYIAGRVDRDQGFQFPKLRLGNLDTYRDWGYAGDYVEAMWMMLQQRIPDDYVICTGESHTIREFLDVAFNHVKIEDWQKHIVIDPEFYRPAEVDYLRGRNHRAKEKLGWTPKYSFKDLVKLMIDHDTKQTEE